VRVGQRVAITVGRLVRVHSHGAPERGQRGTRPSRLLLIRWDPKKVKSSGGARIRSCPSWVSHNRSLSATLLVKSAVIRKLT
jgi:hypothetical protein